MLQINKKTFLSNLSLLLRIAKKNTSQLAIVAKANAYGHGIIPIISIIKESEDVAMVCVKDPDEALMVRNAGWDKSLLIFAYECSHNFLHFASSQNCSITAFSLESAVKIREFVDTTNKSITVHIEIESGMNRLGVKEADIEKICKILSNRFISVHGAYSHCYDNRRACTKNMREQCNYFNQRTEKIFSHFPFIKRHILASGGIDLPFFYDYLRIGSLIYGLWKSEEQMQRLILTSPFMKDLQQVLQWSTTVLHLHTVNPGEHIGYGYETIFDKKKKVAIVPVGYSDGYIKLIQKNDHGKVLINGTYCRLIAINMNFTIIDVTDLFKISIGDTVWLTHPEHQLITLSQMGYGINSEGIVIAAGIKESIPRMVI